jgi:hydrogenase/urease accessory protein HupE
VRRLSAGLLIGLVALWLVGTRAAHSHEIGTTQVRFKIHVDGTWSAFVTTAPTVLVNRLEIKAGERRSSDLTAASVQEKLAHFKPALNAQLEVRFDGALVPASTSIDQVEMPEDILLPAFIVLRVEGRIPDGARVSTWRWLPIASTYAVAFRNERDGSEQVQWLEADATSQPFPVAAGSRPQARIGLVLQYLELGFLHIVPQGLDHILFVLGIYLLSTRLRPILLQITAFTVGHSVTLGLSLYGVLSLPPPIVEPLIALSIAYVGVENVATWKLMPWRPALVFGFGLLHGLGFADALTKLRLPRSEFLPALVSFNIGIELAQLVVIATAFLTTGLWFCNRPWYRTRIVIPVSTLIAATGLFWSVERLSTRDTRAGAGLRSEPVHHLFVSKSLAPDTQIDVRWCKCVRHCAFGMHCPMQRGVER